MMATVPNVTSGSGLRKFQADGFLFDRVYKATCDYSKFSKVLKKKKVHCVDDSS